MKKTFKDYLEEQKKSLLTEKAYLAVAELVGSNKSLDIIKYKKELKSYIKTWKTLYRIWQDYTIEKYIASSKNIKISKKSYISTTKSISQIKNIIEEGDIENLVLISKHSGKGIDPIEVLEAGLKLFTVESNFVKDVINTNKYQQEILFLEPVTKLNKSNVIGFFKDKGIISKYKGEIV